jgi:hypothetical protein
VSTIKSFEGAQSEKKSEIVLEGSELGVSPALKGGDTMLFAGGVGKGRGAGAL